MEVECGRNDYDMSHGVQSTSNKYIIHCSVLNKIVGIFVNFDFKKIKHVHLIINFTNVVNPSQSIFEEKCGIFARNILC